MNNNDYFQTERSKQHILPGEERERCYRILARIIARHLITAKLNTENNIEGWEGKLDATSE